MPDASGIASIVASYWTENGRQSLLEGDANGRGGARIRNEVRATKRSCVMPQIESSEIAR